MIYILFFGLCCMFVTAYLMNQKDILSPWVITIGMFLVSTFFAILNIDTWQFTLSPLTVFVILTGVFAFGVGEILISAAFRKTCCYQKESKTEEFQELKFPKR